MALWQGQKTSKEGENQKESSARWCPNCQQIGRNVQIKLYQINLEEAMFLCTEENCPFPFLESDVTMWVIRRPSFQMKFKKKRKQLFGSQMEQKDDLFSLNNTLPSIDQLANFLWGEEKSLLDMDSHEVVNDKNWNVAPNSVDQNMNDGLDSLISSLANEDASMNVSSANNQQESSQQNNFLSETNLFDLTQIPNKDSNVCASELGDLEPYKVAECDKVTTPKPSLQTVSFSDDLSEPSSFKNRLVIQWQNDNSLCWLDVLLNCIVNNSCIRAFLNEKVDKISRQTHSFYRLCSVYDYVQERYNVNVSEPAASNKSQSSQQSYSSMLNDIRKDVFGLLQKQYSIKQGVDQSVHEMFSNFLSLDAQIHELFSVQIRWELECGECKFKRIRRKTTDIISFPSTSYTFHPLDAHFDRTCFSCSAKNQSMHMIMEIVPPCLLMHFQNGLPHNHFKTMDFAIQDHLYSVTAVIQYFENPCKHFVVWIRNCRSPKCQWKRRAPNISPKQIHMIMWEKQGRAPSSSPEDQQRWLSRQLDLIYNEDAMLSGDEFPQEILVEPDSASIVDLEDPLFIAKLKGSGNNPTLARNSETIDLPKSASSPPSPVEFAESEDESPKFEYTEEDIEMLSIACEELKSCPPSPVNNKSFIKPLTRCNDSRPILSLNNKKCHAVVPYFTPVAMHQRHDNSLVKLQKPLAPKKLTCQTSFNSIRPYSRLGASFEPFNAYNASWDSKLRNQKLRLTSHRKNELKMYYSKVRNSSKSEVCYPRYKALLPSNSSSEKSSELSDLSDIFNDFNVMNFTKELMTDASVTSAVP